MKLHRYLGCVYDIFFEEVEIRFLVHKDLLDDKIRDFLILYVRTGYLPRHMRADTERDVIRLTPENIWEHDKAWDEKDYLWFAL